MGTFDITFSDESLISLFLYFYEFYKLNSKGFLKKNIREAPTENNARIVFNASENIPLGSITLPKYAKGIYISFDEDAIIISVSAGLVMYIAYRDKKTWSGKVLQ